MRPLKYFKVLMDIDPIEKIMEQKIAEIKKQRAEKANKINMKSYRAWKKTVMARSY